MSVPRIPHFLATVVLLLCPMFAPAQHNHSQPKTTKVSGADRPELIPDEEAYRAVFATIANQPDAFLNPLNLSRPDRAAAKKAILAYQNAFKASLNNQGDEHTFVQRANLLLKIAKANLADRMSAEGYERIDEYVQEQKQFMTVTSVVYQEGQ